MGVNKAAEMLQVSVNTVRRWADSGKLKSGRTPGGQRRFAVEEIERLRQEIESGGVSA